MPTAPRWRSTVDCTPVARCSSSSSTADRAGTVETRPVDPADIGRSLDIRTRAFGPLASADRADWEQRARTAIDEGRSIGVYDGALLVGRAVIWSFRQWWGGRVLPMAGVAGVVVSPEYRGRGVGTALMQGLIRRGRELGYPLSGLYPATVPVYRRLGWELAGTQDKVTIETGLLRALRGGDVVVREAGPDDAPQMLELMHRQYSESRACGPKDETEEELREELADDSVFAYVADHGFIVYGWEGRDLVVYQIQASDAPTARALWAVVGSGSSIAKSVHAYLAPDDPVHLLVGEAVSTSLEQNRWMLRCLDAAAAIAGRGFPAGLSIDVPVVLGDAQVPENCLTGRLSVEGGSGRLVEGPAEAGAVRLGANGLAALFAGSSITRLLGSGLAAGGDRDAHALLDSAFAGRPAYLLDYF
jgi:predicted acetyltransferase